MRPEGLSKLKKFIHLIGFRTCDLPACSIVLEPLRYRVPPNEAVLVLSYEGLLGSSVILDLGTRWS
jgi:hypothetical protein